MVRPLYFDLISERFGDMAMISTWHLPIRFRFRVRVRFKVRFRVMVMIMVKVTCIVL